MHRPDLTKGELRQTQNTSHMGRRLTNSRMQVGHDQGRSGIVNTNISWKRETPRS